MSSLVANEVDIIAAQFQRRAFQQVPRDFAHPPAHTRRSGERNQRDARMLDKRLAGLDAARQHMKEPFGSPCFLKQACQNERGISWRDSAHDAKRNTGRRRRPPVRPGQGKPLGRCRERAGHVTRAITQGPMLL
jgi:hypothetical protein